MYKKYPNITPYSHKITSTHRITLLRNTPLRACQATEKTSPVRPENIIL